MTLFTELILKNPLGFVSNSELGGGKSSMTITKWDITTGELQTWKSQSGDLRIEIIDSVLIDNKPIQLVKFEFGGPVELTSLEKRQLQLVFFILKIN